MIEMADWAATRKQKRLIKKVLKSGRLTYGDMTRRLEERFAKLHGARYALFTNSGTSALKISLHALKDKYGWTKGDEIIIPSVTFVATMNAVLMNGLKPVIVDVDPNTANLDPTKIKQAVTLRTRAILPVHLLGQPANMPAIMKVAKELDLEVIEDSCETMFVNKLKGTTACFSSYIAHLMVTGVGGFILTNDKELATVMRSIMFHGRDESYLTIDDNDKTGKAWEQMVQKRFHFPRHGYSDRATELEAALGLGDLDNWEVMIEQRQQNASHLIIHLGDEFAFPVVDVKKHAFMFFPIYVTQRDELMMYLERHGIHTRTMMPLTTQPITKPYLKGDYPGADYINKHGLLLPCHQYLSQQDLDHMIKTIKEFYHA